jgi:hypothetical protein
MEEEFDQSFMAAEREYRATLKGFKTVTFNLPKRVYNSIELNFKPTVGTLLRKNMNWIAVVVLAFLLGVGAGFGLKCWLDDIKEQREIEEALKQAKAELETLSLKLTTVEFTSSDVKAVDEFIKQHDELKEEEEVATAKERIEAAAVMMDLCSGNDDALAKALKIKDLSEVQATLLRDIEAMLELTEFDQNSSSLEGLKNDLNAHRKANAEASADQQEKIAQFGRLCAKLSSLTCTLQQLDDIMKFGKDNGFEGDRRYKQAEKLKLCILWLNNKNSTGGKLYADSEKIKGYIDNYITNNFVPASAIDFLKKVKADQAVLESLPLDADCKSLAEVKLEIKKATGVQL